jgi:hypothetical protein
MTRQEERKKQLSESASTINGHAGIVPEETFPAEKKINKKKGRNGEADYFSIRQTA